MGEVLVYVDHVDGAVLSYPGPADPRPSHG